MKAWTLACIVVGLGLVLVFSQVSSSGSPGTAPVIPARRDSPTAADTLAASALRHSAYWMVYAPAKTPGRAIRRLALTRFADKLVPNDPQTAWLLAQSHAGQGMMRPAAEATRTYLAAYPDDFARWADWLNYSLAAIGDTAEQRLSFLQKVAEDESIPRAVRAEAESQIGSLYVRQGEKGKAADAWKLALQLDDRSPVALEGRVAASGLAPVERAAALMGLLRANPLDYDSAWDLGWLLGAQGLYEKEVEFCEHGWEVVWRRGDPDTQARFFGDYMDALLDAGQAKKALEKLAPVAQKLGKNLDVRLLQVEAWQMLGDANQAQEVLRELTAAYEKKEAGASISPDFAREVARFYLVMLRRPEAALKYARQAERLAGEDPNVQKVLGAAELAGGDKGLAAAGEARLRKLLQKDAEAAAFLAEHYYASGAKEAGEKALQAGAAVTRRGPAFRRLAAIAGKQGVKLAPAPEQAGVLKVVESFDRRCLEMALAPEKFLRVTIRPVVPRVLPGEPVEVEATLENIGPVDLPLGDGGLVSPVMGLRVTVEGFTDVFTDVPMVIWPAPRYLGSGKAVTARARLDVGRLGDFLATRPLWDLTLKVEGILGPIQKDTNFESWLPTVTIEPAKLVRQDLLEIPDLSGQFDRGSAAAWPQAYQTALGYVVRDMKQGELPARVRAARQVGALLTLVQQIETKRLEAPKNLRGQATKPVLLTMLREVLKDPSPVVRSEMLAALGTAVLDGGILEQIAPAVSDPSPLVRFRAVELIGASGTAGRQTIVDFLVQDPDELVRLMASAFLAKAKE